MKIISNYKDYYDYLQGKFGMDEKVVYERTCAKAPSSQIHGKEKLEWKKVPVFTPSKEEYPTYHSLAICGKMFRICIFRDKFYHGEEVVEILPLLKKIKNIVLPYTTMTKQEVLKEYYDNISKFSYTPNTWQSFMVRDKNSWDNQNNSIAQKINKNCQSPIVYLDKYNDYYKNVRLSSFGIGSVYPAETLFVDLYNFLTKEKEIVDNRTDIEKLENAGFDKKTSFRNVK